MTTILGMSIREKLWHSMRRDLAQFMPQVAESRLLMCPCCGRFLPQEHFSLEHIVPQQALKDDPPEVRANRDTSMNIRAGNILLCIKPLKHRGNVVYGSGCNSWKGKWFDGCIRETLSGRTQELGQRQHGAHHIVAMVSAAYLAMVEKFGYSVVLMHSGLLMRHQFFTPKKPRSDLPVTSQILLKGGTIPYNPNDLSPWTNPFTFHIDMEYRICSVGFRNVVLNIPITADPRSITPTRLIVMPSNAKLALRPRFDTFFD